MKLTLNYMTSVFSDTKIIHLSKQFDEEKIEKKS